MRAWHAQHSIGIMIITGMLAMRCLSLLNDHVRTDLDNCHVNKMTSWWISYEFYVVECSWEMHQVITIGSIAVCPK